MVPARIVKPFFAVALLLCAHLAFAQDYVITAGDTASYRIVLDDKTELTGVIEGSEGGTMRIRTAAMGMVSVPLTRIVSMKRLAAPSQPQTPTRTEKEPARPEVRTLEPPLPPVPVPNSGQAGRDVPPADRWFRERHTSRYFLAPSAHPLKQGEGYYRNTCLLVQSASVGVTNNLSLNAGFEALSFFGFSQAPGFHAGAKLAFKLHRYIHLGFAANYMNAATEYEWNPPFSNNDGYHDPVPRIGVGAFHGMLTIGDERFHGTFGGGTRVDTDNGLEETPTFSLGLAARLTPRFWVISDNWVFGHDEEYNPWWSYGIRYASRGVAVDVAFVNNPDWYYLYPYMWFGLPFVSVCINFGHRYDKPM